MTYAGLAAVFVAACGVVAVIATLRCHLPARWWIVTGATIAILLFLTIVFDSLMIQADLFGFDQTFLLGVHVWHAPVEDLAWPVAAGLLLPSLRELLAHREPTP